MNDEEYEYKVIIAAKMHEELRIYILGFDIKYAKALAEGKATTP
ncbi:hypothetical protein [Pedobacter sp. D749]|nr:hypothetical protein [Pedobacter sp. D749]